MSGEARSELQVDRDPAPETPALVWKVPRCATGPAVVGGAPTDVVVTAVNGRLALIAQKAPGSAANRSGSCSGSASWVEAGNHRVFGRRWPVRLLVCSRRRRPTPGRSERVGSRGPERMDGPPVGYHPLSSDWHMTATADKGLPLGWRSPARCTDSSYGICQWRVRDYRVSRRVAHDVTPARGERRANGARKVAQPALRV